ncbi:hypothetical protein TSOC_000845 [Tetrabaena socialis]|uniref:Uncharacterized protein n=1 Tax=Tetrabaena socialis TaxID=47790 RepID=A0A2J8AIA3_9CHLO|nr:hypothetical protein TSOC_000845 [Tetrabaena socialis]|eukprot:PNH12253.1 hypothetical protein TSOC_000845 [Tetrabaena socialis]
MGVDLELHDRLLRLAPVIGGIIAAKPHAEEAQRLLIRALAGLAALWAAVSWLLLSAGCSISHTQAEAIACTPATLAAAAHAGEPANLPAVRRLSGWLLGVLPSGGAPSGGVAGQGAADPLLAP